MEHGYGRIHQSFRLVRGNVAPWWVRERQVVADEAADEAMMAADVRHEQNILLWYLPPPC